MNQKPSAYTPGRNQPARYPAFDELQQKLVPLWEHIGRQDPGGPIQQGNTVVVINSLPPENKVPANMLRAYEQRFLFLLFLLRQPDIRLIYVTSSAIDQNIIDYYLNTIPGIVISSARKRLFLVDVGDLGIEPLAQKLLDRPAAIQQIRNLIPNRDRAHMVPYVTTHRERDLAVKLGIPIFGADPAYLGFGTKSGGRRIFEEEGVPYPLGAEDLFSEAELVAAICRIRARRPGLARIIVKLNEGASGIGNATVNCRDLPPAGDPHETAAATEALRNMEFEQPGVRYADYMANVETMGAIVEEYITGRAYRSPSAQLRVSPLGEVEMLSTHDQILGGPSGQSYLGARFPADTGYAAVIMREAYKIGRRLAKEGVLGRFAVDFVVVQDDDGHWQPYAIEINLRKGGTTAPYLSLQYLTDGRYDEAAGVFHTFTGAEKYYVSSDHVESPAYRVFTAGRLLDIVSRYRLHFDHTCHTGIILHMFCDVGSAGMLGATAIADSPDEADTLYQRLVTVLDREAGMD